MLTKRKRVLKAVSFLAPPPHYVPVEEGHGDMPEGSLTEFGFLRVSGWPSISARTQRLQNPLIKEYTLNYSRSPSKI